MLTQTPSAALHASSCGTDIFTPTQQNIMAASGAAPMVTWDPVSPDGGQVSYADIALGSEDQYLASQAAVAVAWHRPLYIRLAHEMNTQTYVWGATVDGNTPQAFIAAWQHVVTLFRQLGAVNVRWVWSPNVDCEGTCPFDAYYPGDQYVDWVALDGYNFAGFQGHAPWSSLWAIFGPSYRDITRLTGKPLMIAETACNPTGGNKARWIRRGFLNQIPRLMPRVRAVVWWDNVYAGVDWKVDSSAASLAAWRSVVASPLYGGGGSTPAAGRA